MPPFACAPSTMPRGPVPRSKIALAAGGDGRYRCRPGIGIPQDGPARDDCGLVAVADAGAGELLGRDGAEVFEQPDTAKAVTASTQPRTRIQSDAVPCTAGSVVMPS